MMRKRLDMDVFKDIVEENKLKWLQSRNVKR